MKNFLVIQFGSRMNYVIPRILFKNGYLIQFYKDFLINNFFFLKKIQKYLLPNFISQFFWFITKIDIKNE